MIIGTRIQGPLRSLPLYETIFRAILCNDRDWGTIKLLLKYGVLSNTIEHVGGRIGGPTFEDLFDDLKLMGDRYLALHERLKILKLLLRSGLSEMAALIGVVKLNGPMPPLSYKLLLPLDRTFLNELTKQDERLRERDDLGMGPLRWL